MTILYVSKISSCFKPYIIGRPDFMDRVLCFIRKVTEALQPFEGFMVQTDGHMIDTSDISSQKGLRTQLLPAHRVMIYIYVVFF